MTKRACKGTTRAGSPCKANPPKTSDYCRAHDPELPPSARFGSHAQAREAGKLGGRPALPRPTDVARRLVEENVYKILRPHFRTLGLDIEGDGSVTELERGAIVTGESRDGHVIASTIEDLGAQIAAAEKLLDRVYGKPKQTSEISGPEGAPVELVEIPVDADERSRRAAALLAQHGHANQQQ